MVAAYRGQWFGQMVAAPYGYMETRLYLSITFYTKIFDHHCFNCCTRYKFVLLLFFFTVGFPFARCFANHAVSFCLSLRHLITIILKPGFHMIARVVPVAPVAEKTYQRS